MFCSLSEDRRQLMPLAGWGWGGVGGTPLRSNVISGTDDDIVELNTQGGMEGQRSQMAESGNEAARLQMEINEAP